MKKSTKILSLLLAVLMAFGVMTVGVSAAEAVTCEHEYGKWIITQDETCDEDGIKYRECSKCTSEVPGHIEIGKVLAVGHTYGEGVVTAPTCANKGYTTYTCSTCNGTKTENEVSALEHTYGEWKEISAPTCTAEGKKERVCSVCAETALGHVQTENVPMVAHNYVATVVAPTYTEVGYTLHKCLACGDNYKTDETPILKGKVTSVELSDYIAVMYNQSYQLPEPTVKMEGNVSYTVEYFMLNEKVAVVDQNGLVVGKGMGSADLVCRVTDEYGNVVEDKFEIEVKFSVADWFSLIWQILKVALEVVVGGIFKGIIK